MHLAISVTNIMLFLIAVKAKARIFIVIYNQLTFKELKKRVSLETTQQQSKLILFERLLNKSFWIWDQQQHKLEDIITNGDCCFNHIIGLPQKDNADKPLFDYERMIYDSLVTENGDAKNIFG
jgi:hypothetical protein